MRHKIALYIKDALIDLDDASFILFNYTQDDVTDPAVVVNSFTQEITLPATAANNAVFSTFGRLDRVTGSGFNTSVREPFAIYAEDGRILQKGYCRMDGATRQRGRVVSYKVTLFGGLGSLFYFLSSKDNGDAKTLGVLTWEDGDGNYYGPDDTYDYDPLSAWEDLEMGNDSGPNGIFNFCPMYNGLPEGFDCNKAVCQPGVFDNVPSRVYKDGSYYCGKAGVNTPYVVTFENKHTEWGAKDIRSYLQRLIVRVDKLLAAICAYAAENGHNLSVNASVWSMSQLNNLWLTMPILAQEYRNKRSPKLSEIFQGTISPGAFLIGFAKALGLVFYTDAEGTTIYTRDEFYNAQRSDILDLSERVDTASEISVAPVYADSHFYDFSFPSIGADAAAVKDKTGRELGSVRVDTGYPFNEDIKDVLSGTPFKYCAHIQSKNTDNIAHFFTEENGSVYQEYIPMSAFETLKATMYKMNGTAVTTETAEVELPSVSGLYIAAEAAMGDWASRLQAEDKDRKGLDGAYLLAKYDGFEECGELEYDDAQGTAVTLDPVQYYFTYWDQTRVNLNAGVDCWDLRGTAPTRAALPSFYALSPSTLFDARWKAYINDLYNKDTAVLTCKVDLRGLPAGEGLLRRFYWYDGALWTLNKIVNHSLTTSDLTECEFIKVQDAANYYNGQN